MGGDAAKKATTFFLPTRVLEHGKISEGNNLMHLFVPFSQLGSDDNKQSKIVTNPDAQTFTNTTSRQTVAPSKTILSRQAGDTFGNTYFK